MSGRRQSDRPKKLPSRFVGWYGMRMLTASREKTLKPAVSTTAGRGRTADDRELSVVLQGDDSHQIAVPPDEQMNDGDQIAAPSASDDQIAVSQDECIDDGDQIAAPLDDYQSAFPSDDHQNAVSPDECMYDDHREPERIARDRFRRKTGYAILKRRKRELRKSMYSFSPPERPVIYRRLILNNSDEDDDNNENDDCEHSVNHVQSQTDESQKKVRKRQRNDSKWKKNVIKRARLTGQAYISSTGKKISAKAPVLDEKLCGKAKCRLNCDDKVDRESRAAIMSQYYSLSAESQTSHLFSSLNVSTPKWSMLNAERHREISVKYTVSVQGSSVTVCKKAFMNLYGVTQSKVDHVVSQLRAGQATVRPSLRGKHSNRPNRLTQVTIDSIKEHVNLYPAEMSHYSRFHNPNRMYLSPLLSITEMYRQYKVWTNERGIPPASLAAYRRVFCTHFNLGFGSPRSDTCCKCEASNSADIARHKEMAEVAFQQQRQDREEARTKSNVMYITFDLEKTLPLPKLSVSKAFYMRQLWVYNMGIHLVAKGKEGPYFNVWTEDEAGRGVTEVASALMVFVQSLQTKGGTLIAWNDSCSGQNKNFLMLCLWQYLVAKNFFHCIQHKFPEPGHSFLDSDRDFGRIEAVVRRHENVYTLDDYCDIMLKSAHKSRPVLTRMGDKMSNISSLPTMLGLKKVVVNLDGERIQLRDRVKWIQITKFGYFQYKHSFDIDEQWKEACLVKNGTGRVMTSDEIPDMPVIPVARRTVNSAKVNDIKKQLEFIPSIYRGYYKKVIDEASVNPDHSSADGNEGDDASDDDQEVTIRDPTVSEVTVSVHILYLNFQMVIVFI